jgi:hypothetical protein
MIKATYDSTNFSFTAYGRTNAQAIDALKSGLVQHARDYGLDDNWWQRYECDITTERIEFNKAYRDHELIKVAA